MKKVMVKMNKPIYLGQAILDISKTLMYEFWYDYIKPKYEDKARLCYMDTDSFIMHIKTEDFYKDIANDVERLFDTSNYDKKDNRPLPIGKNKKVIGLFKDELGGKIMTEFCALRAKAYAYKLDDDTEMKKAKGTKKCIVKREITFKNYVDALFNDEVIIKSQQRFRSDHHRVYTEEVNKIALSSNDDKRIQTYDKITTYPYGTNIFKMCENEIKYMLQRRSNDLQPLRDKSLILRNNTQAFIDEAHTIRNNSQALIDEAHALRNNSQITKNQPHKLISEAQALRNNSQITRNEAQALRNNSQITKNESQKLISEAQALRNNSQITINEA